VPEAPSSRPTSVKVVVTGPNEVGKTTLIRTLSEINVLTTERRVPLIGSGGGDEMTVAMDFGRMTVDADLQLYLFGTTGQPRLDFVWEIIDEGLLGFIVVVDHTRPDSIDGAADVLAYLADRGDVPYVVAANKTPSDLHDRAVKNVRHQLRLPEDLRVVAGDARDRDAAKGFLLELFEAARDHAARVASDR
jgi:uncharacterized protein